MQPHQSYLICATPRSGSTLLCEALTATGVAGKPKEYFEALKMTGLPRRPGEYFATFANPAIRAWLNTLSPPHEASPQPLFWSSSSYSAYLSKVMEEGTTPNGVFGAKVMYGYLADFISNLRLIPGYRDLELPDLLSTVFPNLRCIYITRRDKVRQAVSLWKAIQTGVWKVEENTLSEPSPDFQAPSLTFHFAAIEHLIEQIVADERAWHAYFEQGGIQPLTVVYEEWLASYEATIQNILTALQIGWPERWEPAHQRMKRQADALSEEWVQLYYFHRRQREESTLNVAGQRGE